MRMWKVNPKILCRKHLLGEHVEMHMFIGALRKKQKLTGFIHKGLVEVHNIYARHATLAHELQKRGYSHHSPLPVIATYKAGHVSVKASKRELYKRCKDCRKLLRKYYPLFTLKTA